MKKICLALTVVVLAVLCGCTQYNGHIGPLFGSWSLVGMTADGQPMALPDETVFSFQNEVVRVVRLIDPPYTTSARYGNFIHEDGQLILKFQPSPTPTGGQQYMAPDWLGFPEGENVIVFKVLQLNGSKMRLELVGDGPAVVYAFEKTW